MRRVGEEDSVQSDLQRISMQVQSQTELTTETHGGSAGAWFRELGEKTCQRNQNTDGGGQ